MNTEDIHDRYGNRTNVTATGTAVDSSPIPLDGIPNLSYDNATNRINDRLRIRRGRKSDKVFTG